MVRTSRNGAPSASVDALDNLNLDDMFADEGDALFDGLDIDLGNMDDITGGLEDSGPPMNKKSDSSGPLHLDDMETEDDSRKRRKTKRKIKSPMFYEDEDDDYVEEMSKKKKKRSSVAKAPAPASTSSATRKRPSTARGSAPKPSPIVEVEAPPAAPARQITGKAKGRTSLTMPPPHSRQGSSAVAAAGQFGGRQTKRGNSFAVPKVSKTKSSASLPPIPAAAADTITTTTAKAQRAQSVTLASTMAQIQATHPGLNQSPFCGLLPSNTLFYPFMPALPPEPTFKQRKIFAMVDRIHSSFMSHLSAPTGSAASSGVTPVKETEPIFTLMQEAFKEEKGVAEASAADRIASVGNAVGALRRSISLFEKNRLAGDLLAVAALLKRQYDFLRQNNANMEQWCRSHFTDEDFAMIYVPPKNKAKKRIAESAVLTSTSILKSLTSSDVKVKVICNGFKEPTLAPLVAHVLPLLGPAKSKSKKRKAPPPVAPKPVVPTPVDVPEAKPPVVPYSELRPNKRRRSIADLIALTGRHLEAKYLQRFDDQRQAIDKQQSEMRKLVDEDTQGLHTLGMWQWLEKSGYFANISEPDIRWRLDGLISPAGTGTGPGCPSVVLKESEGEKTSKAPGGSLVQRLQSLLICDDAGVSGDETDDESDLYDDEKVGMRVDLDLTGLTVDERSFLYLNSIGLVESELPRTLQLEAIESVRSLSCERVHLPSNSDTVGRQRVQNANQGYRLSNPREGLDELGVIVNAMVSDLSAVNELNSRRTHFLEAVAKTHRRVESESHQAEEGSVLLKYQQMMKSKELKNKNGKAKVVKNDEHALPW